MKANLRQQSAEPKDDHTRIYFNIFMALLGLGFVYVIVLLFMV